MSESAANYEFSSEENEKLSLLVTRLRRPLMPLSLFVMLQVVIAFGMSGFRLSTLHEAAAPYSLLLAAVCFAFSVLIWHASCDFQKIVDTEGSDIEHLMAALKKVSQSLMVASGVMLVFIALVGAAVLSLVLSL